MSNVQPYSSNVYELNCNLVQISCSIRFHWCIRIKKIPKLNRIIQFCSNIHSNFRAKSAICRTNVGHMVMVSAYFSPEKGKKIAGGRVLGAAKFWNAVILTRMIYFELLSGQNWPHYLIVKKFENTFAKLFNPTFRKQLLSISFFRNLQFIYVQIFSRSTDFIFCQKINLNLFSAELFKTHFK